MSDMALKFTGSKNMSLGVEMELHSVAESLVEKFRQGKPLSVGGSE